MDLESWGLAAIYQVVGPNFSIFTTSQMAIMNEWVKN